MVKKILLGILIFVVGSVAVLAGTVALQPNEYRVERTATMNAAPATVFDQVNDFHKWDAWSPWAKLDPNCKFTYDGPSSGTGAVCAWSGNDEVGEGRMTILESRPNEFIRIKLEFIRPFEDQCEVTFNFKPQGEQTFVSWVMNGRNNFVGKVFCLVMDMDKCVGGDFEKGLAQMKTVAEAAEKK